MLVFQERLKQIIERMKRMIELLRGCDGRLKRMIELPSIVGAKWIIQYCQCKVNYLVLSEHACRLVSFLIDLP